MRFRSGLLADASGSVGGYTYSHNAGGQYIRQRSIPTDPGTSYQAAVRGYVASLVNLWSATLTAAQRDAWNTYAENVPLLDVFGDPRYRSGINHYVRSNTPRLQAGFARVDDGPTTFNLGEFTAPTIAIDEATQMLGVTFTDTDAWVGEDDAGLLIRMSKPQAATINFYKGPYRFLDSIDGDGTTPPTSPATIALAEVYAVGQQGFVIANVSRADGRLGTPFRDSAVAA